MCWYVGALVVLLVLVVVAVGVEAVMSMLVGGVVGNHGRRWLLVGWLGRVLAGTEGVPTWSVAKCSGWTVARPCCGYGLLLGLLA